MAENRYVKLNANWMDSEWLIVLSAEARLAWVQLLCYVKAYGIGGRVKSKSPQVFAKQNFLGEESVEQMLRAAKADGALEYEEGEWVLTGWSQHQGDATNNERQKRYRDRKNKVAEVLERDGYKCVSCGTKEDLVIDHVIPVIDGGDTTLENLQSLCRTCNLKKGAKPSNGRNALLTPCNTEEKRGEERKGDTPLPTVDPQRGSRRGSRPADVAEVKAYGKEIGLPVEECQDFWDHYENNGWKVSGKTPMRDWKLAANRWKRTWEKSRPKAPGSTTQPPDPDRQWPKEGLDYVLVAKGNDPAKRYQLDKETPFSEDAWRKARGLLTRAEMAEIVQR